MNKLAAIYCIWDGVTLLKGSMNCLKNYVDIFIIVWQDISNFGEQYDPFEELDLSDYPCVFVKFAPEIIAGTLNEKKKRNLGIETAKQLNCTHFVQMDCDEYYMDFGAAKQAYINSNIPGSVCKIFTYFQKPIYRCDIEDGYYVPFIHQLRPDTRTGERDYPFYVDPTRRINEPSVVILDVYMHHFSWIRRDIGKKCRNSSAKKNIEKGTILEDYKKEIHEGFYIRDWDRRIKIVDNYFDIVF